MLNQFQKNKLSLQVMLASVLMAGGAAMAQSVPATDPLTAITSAITTILAIIALGGAGYITLRLAHVGWVVGAKFISRLGGKS